MDVLQAAWRAAGSPYPGGLVFDVTGRCARCGTDDVVTPAAAVVSAKWTGWSSWRTASRPVLCPACAWGYRTPAHRQGALLVTTTPTLRALAPAELVEVLSGAIDADTAVALPVRLNRKHSLPSSAWGRVTVDEVPVRWTAADAQRFTVLVQLRSYRFTSRALAQPAPDYRTLMTLPGQERRQVMAVWPVLDPWRPATPWMVGACVAAGMFCAAVAA